MAKPLRKEQDAQADVKRINDVDNDPQIVNSEMTDQQLDRARAMRAAANQDPRRLQQEIEKLDAETEEEVDALRVNLLQDDERGTPHDGTGRVVDDLAEQKIARFTEAGPMAGERGGVSITPGRDDASNILRRHHPNTAVARAEDMVEGNLDEPSDEEVMERKADEGTAA